MQIIDDLLSRLDPCIVSGGVLELFGELAKQLFYARFGHPQTFKRHMLKPVNIHLRLPG
jgi:hypothetical protein